MSDDTTDTVTVILSRVTGRSKVYHTDRGCPTLSDVGDDRTRQREKDSLDDRFSLCAFCDPERCHPAEVDQDHSVRRVLQDPNVTTWDDVAERMGGAD
jgi:hypothetical protein